MGFTDLQNLKGFRDFFPEEMAERTHVFDAMRRVAKRYGFSEYDGPPLENLDLYKKKSGDEIVAQLYNFKDKGGREVALRPEMTPTFARMVAARAPSLQKPIKWFSIPQLFRYVLFGHHYGAEHGREPGNGRVMMPEKNVAF